MTNPIPFAPNHQFDLSMLSQGEKERFKAVVVEMREHQEGFHAKWELMPSRMKDDTLTIYAAKKFWALEWSLTQIKLIPRPAEDLSEFQTNKSASAIGSSESSRRVNNTDDRRADVVHDSCLLSQGQGSLCKHIASSGIPGFEAAKEAILSAELEDLFKGRNGSNIRRSACLSTKYGTNRESALPCGKSGGAINSDNNQTASNSGKAPRFRRVLSEARGTRIHGQAGDDPGLGTCSSTLGAMGWTRHIEQISDLVAQYPLPQGHAETMNNNTIVSWNVRGAGNPNFMRAVRDLVVRYNPNILILTETRVPKDRAIHYLARLPFDQWFATDTQGHRGGIWMAWNSASVNVNVLSSTVQEIHP